MKSFLKVVLFVSGWTFRTKTRHPLGYGADRSIAGACWAVCLWSDSTAGGACETGSDSGALSIGSSSASAFSMSASSFCRYARYSSLSFSQRAFSSTRKPNFVASRCSAESSASTSDAESRRHGHPFKRTSTSSLVENVTSANPLHFGWSSGLSWWCRGNEMLSIRHAAGDDACSRDRTKW